VKEVINDLVMKLTWEATAMKMNGGRVNILQAKWSEIVAGVKSSCMKVEHSDTCKIRTIETTQVRQKNFLV
jgi:hypothetical protein